LKRSILVSLFFYSLLSGQVKTFSFTINGQAPAGLVSALQIAGEKWDNYLQIQVSVKANIYFVNSPLIPFSGLTLSNGRKNFNNAPYNNIVYPTALANQLAGTELNPGEADMDIYFNLATVLYYGTGKPSSGQTDFITLAMHELGHGLGFYSDGYVDGSGIGSFGNIPSSAIQPLTTSFPWRGQEGVPSVFDKYIVRKSGVNLINAAPNNSSQLGDSIKNGLLYFKGPLYTNSSPVRLAGGEGTFSLGVDLLHIHDSFENTIMSYAWGDGDTVRTPALWERAMLKEIGWNIKIVGIHEFNKDEINFYPSPADQYIFLNGENISEIKLYALNGEILRRFKVIDSNSVVQINTEDLPDGVYFIRMDLGNGHSTVTRKVVVLH
jgi:hypothetical protein